MSSSPEKYSTDVFQTNLFGQKMAVFCGRQGNKFVYTKTFGTWLPTSAKKIIYFPEFANNGGTHDDQILSFAHEILKPEALTQYLPVMDAMAREQVKSEWDGNDVVKVYPLAKKYTLYLAFRLFTHVVDVHSLKLFENFSNVVAGLFSLPVDLPGTAFNKGLKGGEMIREELLKIISNRRKHPSSSTTDFLSRLLLLKDENGNFLSERELSNNIFGLLMASNGTTSIALTFMLKYLGELPHIYDNVYKELMEIAQSKKEGELLTWQDMQKMKYTYKVLCESLRLSPPAFGGFREAINDVSFAGFIIPKGWKVMWTVHSTHKDPDYFPDPENFDPSRFEGNGPAPYTFVPFGGGSKKCPGREYARFEILVYVYNILTRYKLEMFNPNEKIIIFQNFPTPEEGLPLRLIPHKK